MISIQSSSVLHHQANTEVSSVFPKKVLLYLVASLWDHYGKISEVC